MADTYSQIYIQIVFAVSGRQNLNRRQHKEELHKYISGIVSQRRQKLLAIHCMPDHTHMLVGLKPSMALSDLVRDVKNSSTNFINTKKWVAGRFSWQDGFGAFSYGHSQLTTILNYIRNQERHHAKRTFREEYLQFLKKYEIEHEERYTLRVQYRQVCRKQTSDCVRIENRYAVAVETDGLMQANMDDAY